MEVELMGSMRLDKLLGELSLGSRKELKKLIEGGRISVNGESILKSNLKVDPERDRICLDGKEISYLSHEYIMLNKPAGYVSARSDKEHRTVMELVSSRRKDLFPLGRLDLDTEGLLLISNDGRLAHDLLSPSKHVDKTYYVRVDKALGEEEVERMGEGISLNGEYTTKPAKLEILSSSARESEARITITEGKFHQVKRMFQALGIKVLYLKRIGFGGLWLDEEELAPGESRSLSLEEIDILRKR
ncbi:MAG: pseudouridine synthase [Johnsonella sp.]|nr:pseudouridine synthase [Johnsonella sp.]